MSCLNHQPISKKKRRLTHEAPEFPSLPVFSLIDVVEFAKKSQRALESVDFSANSTTLFLPLITPHQPDNRFTVDTDHSVFVIMRNEYSILKEVVENMDNNSDGGICVRGPVGVGKSYLLSPFNIIQFLSSNRRTNIKVIISASANNEGYPTKLDGWYTHDIKSRNFINSEFKQWCDHFLLQDNTKVDHESEEAVDALYWTGGVPNELNLLWMQAGDTLAEKTLLYRENRIQDMCASHAKFCRDLADVVGANLLKCISHMALELSPPEGIFGMDRQLFDIVLDLENSQVITILNPVARLALFSFHGASLTTPLGRVAGIELGGVYNSNDVKGKISGLYITTVLELSKKFEFPIRRVENINDPITTTRRIFINEVIYFPSNRLPAKSSFKSNVTTLFVPDSPTNPRFDFFLWDSVRKILMGFQVTVRQPFEDHPKIRILGLAAILLW